MNEPKRIPVNLLPNHLDFIMNVLGTANLRYVDTAPIIQDIGHQVQAYNLTLQPGQQGQGVNGVETQPPLQ